MTVQTHRSDMAGFRIARAFERIPEITGLELTRNGGKWQGGYYIDGTRHPIRRDKLKIFISRGTIWVYEEGGHGMSLPNWLQQYAGASDYWDAIKIIEGESRGFVWDKSVRQKQLKLQYVDPNVVLGAKQYPLERCPLFRWMCSMFPEDKVRATWEKYGVTTDSNGFCVYWYIDQQGRVLFDKRIKYDETGHRTKDFFPSRQYRVADGYTGRCMYGANVADMDKKLYVAESEKAVLLIDLMYGRQAVATGGKSNLRDLEKNMVLLPDYDARDDWGIKAQEAGVEVWPWWERWPVGSVPEHADIADLIELKMLHNKK